MTRFLLAALTSTLAVLCIAALQPVHVPYGMQIDPSAEQIAYSVDQSPTYRWNDWTCITIYDGDLSFVSSLAAAPFIYSDLHYLLTGASTYEFDDDVESDATFMGDLFLDPDGHRIAIVTVTLPYSFYVSDTNQHDETVQHLVFSASPGYVVTTSSLTSLLVFSDGETFRNGVYSVTEPNAYVTLPENTFTQYFKRPLLQYSLMVEYVATAESDPDFFEFSVDLVEARKETASIMLGFNRFNAPNTYYRGSSLIGTAEEE
ncbi:MAG: hypothetical protein WC509_05240 [Candidatus Izemoplasmatales bacterium]